MATTRTRNTKKSDPKVETPEPEAPAVEAELLLTSKDIADDFGTDPKSLRRFLRSTLSPESLPGKGGRYRIKASELEELRTRYATRARSGATTINFKDTPADSADEPIED